MSPTTPLVQITVELCTDRFRALPTRLHMTRKRAVSRIFQWMARKAQQCMQTMADFMRFASAPEQCFQPSMTPQAVICTDVAFAPVRPSRCGLRNSKGDIYFYKGR